MSDLATVEKLAEAVAAYYGGKILKVEETIVVKTDNEEVSAMLNLMGVLAGVPTQHSLRNLTPFPQTMETPLPTSPLPAEGERSEEEVGPAQREFDELMGFSGETPIETDGMDDPAEGGKPRKVCRNCMRLFYTKNDKYSSIKAKCCCAKCSVGYAGRSRHVVAIENQYQYKNQHRHWFYGDEDWFNARLASGNFHENGRVITPEGTLRIIRFSGGHWTYDEVAAA